MCFGFLVGREKGGYSRLIIFVSFVLVCILCTLHVKGGDLVKYCALELLLHHLWSIYNMSSTTDLPNSALTC